MSAATVLVLVGCSAHGTADSVGPGPSPNTLGDTAAAPDSGTLARLEREARALANTEGCTTVSQCRVAPVGAKPCGGPRYWLPYCAASTDSAALFRKLAELEAAEKAYNTAHHIVSDCSIAAPPVPTLQGGMCGGGS